MTGRVYAQSHTDKGLHPKNVSRAIEDSATVTVNPVLRDTGGAYQTATLGMSAIALALFL